MALVQWTAGRWQLTVKVKSQSLISSLSVSILPLFFNPIKDVLAHVHVGVAHFTAMAAEEDRQHQPIAFIKPIQGGLGITPALFERVVEQASEIMAVNIAIIRGSHGRVIIISRLLTDGSR